LGGGVFIEASQIGPAIDEHRVAADRRCLPRQEEFIDRSLGHMAMSRTL